jgi:hypothetical protein
LIEVMKEGVECGFLTVLATTYKKNCKTSPIFRCAAADMAGICPIAVRAIGFAGGIEDVPVVCLGRA